jgi:peptidoglycan hydrolase-like protein with peptidoglycan-binding domain
VRTTTAQVTRQTVTSRVQVSGTLGFDGTFTIVNQLPAGVLTAVTEAGTAVVRGGDLFAVGGLTGVLLYGATPAYRDFAAGMSDGLDIAQLEQNLAALGMDPHHAMTVDSRFTVATEAAIRRWQAARGVPAAERTGTIPLGHVVFLPGAVRVSAVDAGLGATVGPGVPVLTGSSTTRVVTAQVTTDRQSLVHANDQVMVRIPGLAQPVAGTVIRIGRVALAGQGGQGSSGQGPGTGPATVPVTISLQLPAETADLDQAPVQVAITTSRHVGVLTVPVTALLARPGGGYDIRVVEADGTRLLQVQAGLYDDTAGTVEVSGTGLAEGAYVEVPVS